MNYIRHPWMDDLQYSIYAEMCKISQDMLDAMLAKDREKWLKLSLRLREVIQ